MSIGKYFIMGLPEAGKTTYLAALWYILNNSNDSSLRIDNYSGDLSYLVGIGKKWANIEKMPRTLKPSEKLSIELPLTNIRNEQIIRDCSIVTGNILFHSSHCEVSVLFANGLEPVLLVAYQ